MASNAVTDYTLNNPDILTKYNQAGQIARKVLDVVTGWCTQGAQIVLLCEKGDEFLASEMSKVFKDKKINKGIGHPTTISPSSFITPYTPLKSDENEAQTVLHAGEIVKVQLGAQIDGFGAIVCNSFVVPHSEAKPGVDEQITGPAADLLLATHYANEVLLRLMMPTGLAPGGSEADKKLAESQKPIGQAKMTQLLEKVVKSYGCNLVDSTTSWLFDRNEIESTKKIIISPEDGVKGEGLPEIGEVWGVEMGVSLGSGKVKVLSSNRPTLLRRTALTYRLKRPSSKAMLSEIVKKFGNFPFSLRQLDDERAAKLGVLECVRMNVLRQYEVVGDKDNEAVSRLFTTIAITKNGITRLSAPPDMDLSKLKTDKKIEDEEVLKILEKPICKPGMSKNKSDKKKKKKKTAKMVMEDEECCDDCR